MAWNSRRRSESSESDLEDGNFDLCEDQDGGYEAPVECLSFEFSDVITTSSDGSGSEEQSFGDNSDSKASDLPTEDIEGRTSKVQSFGDDSDSKASDLPTEDIEGRTCKVQSFGDDSDSKASDLPNEDIEVKTSTRNFEIQGSFSSEDNETTDEGSSWENSTGPAKVMRSMDSDIVKRPKMPLLCAATGCCILIVGIVLVVVLVLRSSNTGVGGVSSVQSGLTLQPVSSTAPSPSLFTTVPDNSSARPSPPDTGTHKPSFIPKTTSPHHVATNHSHTGSVQPTSRPKRPSAVQSVHPVSQEPTKTPTSTLSQSTTPTRISLSHTKTPTQITPTSTPTSTRSPSTTPTKITLSLTKTPTQITRNPTETPTSRRSPSSTPTQITLSPTTTPTQITPTPTTTKTPLTLTPTTTPTQITVAEKLTKWLQGITDIRDIKNHTTPQGKAFSTLVNQDLTNSFSEERILQRYALLTLYFATNPREWLNTSGWSLETDDECSWYGISRCNATVTGGDPQVFKLKLASNNLSGPIPSEICLLKELRVLNLSGNNLSGTIPTCLGQLTHLVVLALQNNGLTGNVSSIICDLGLPIFAADCKKAIDCNCCTACY